MLYEIIGIVSYFLFFLRRAYVIAERRKEMEMNKEGKENANGNENGNANGNANGIDLNRYRLDPATSPRFASSSPPLPLPLPVLPSDRIPGLSESSFPPAKSSSATAA